MQNEIESRSSLSHLETIRMIKVVIIMNMMTTASPAGEVGCGQRVRGVVYGVWIMLSWRRHPAKTLPRQCCLVIESS